MPDERRDTTAEVAALLHERWRAMAPPDRLTYMLRWTHQLNLFRYNAIRARHPEASEAELMAIWTEETYRGTVAPGFLARACAAILARGVPSTAAD